MSMGTDGEACGSGVFAAALVPMALADLDLGVVDVNPALCALLGVDRDQAIGRPLADLVTSATPAWSAFRRNPLETLNRRGSVDIHVLAVGHDASVTALRLHATTVGACGPVLVQLQPTGASLVVHGRDPLTGLRTKPAFLEHLQRATLEKARTTSAVGVLFVDVDGVGVANDELGHAAGDDVIKAAADVLTHTVRPGDVVSRHAGDEFLVLLEEISDQQDAVTVAERIVERIRDLRSAVRIDTPTSASVGISVTKDPHASAVELVRRADLAMHRAKERGGDQWQAFDAATYDELKRRHELVRNLRNALARSELELHYQPIVQLSNREPYAVEALLRWNHPEHGLIAAADFVPLVVDSHAMVEVGAWVLGRAAADLRDWEVRTGRTAPRRVHVNVAAQQLLDSSFRDVVRAAVTGAGLDLDRLCLEVKEHELFRDEARAGAVLEDLADEGCRWAVDDFGVGRSSLARLAAMPVAAVKTDRALLQQVPTDRRARTLFGAVTDVGNRLGIEVIVEGVERREQLEAIDRLGVKWAQGYLMGRPARMAA